MTREELIAEFRRQVEDQAEPYLWEDDDVVRYLIDAQDTLVRHIGGIADETVAAADDPDNEQLQDLPLVDGEAFSDLSPYILRIRAARLLTAQRDVQIANYADLVVSQRQDYGASMPLRLDDTEGQVIQGLLGVRDDSVRWVYIPDAADTCRMIVYRLPYPRMAVGNAVELEVSDIHHLHLVKWMKHLAYSKEDAETYDKTLADRNERAFRDYCEQVKAETERRRFKPRVVQYRGI